MTAVIVLTSFVGISPMRSVTRAFLNFYGWNMGTPWAAAKKSASL